jgi:hypothetical protein
MKRRSRMGLKYSMSVAVIVVGVLGLASMSAVAQEIKQSEVSIEDTGFFTNGWTSISQPSAGL